MPLLYKLVNKSIMHTGFQMPWLTKAINDKFIIFLLMLAPFVLNTCSYIYLEGLYYSLFVKLSVNVHTADYVARCWKMANDVIGIHVRCYIMFCRKLWETIATIYFITGSRPAKSKLISLFMRGLVRVANEDLALLVIQTE